LALLGRIVPWSWCSKDEKANPYPGVALIPLLEECKSQLNPNIAESRSFAVTVARSLISPNGSDATFHRLVEICAAYQPDSRTALRAAAGGRNSQETRGFCR
jgi:hypothetical protein